MATGAVRALRKVQIGKETTKGTSVPATELLLCEGDVSAKYPLYRNKAPFGVLAQNAGPIKLLSKDVDVSLKFDGISYEQMTWLLNMGIDVPTTAGIGPYQHVYDPGAAALANPDAMTIEGQWTDGTDNTAIEIEYCMARKLAFSGDQNGELKVAADVFGRQITNAAITSLTLQTNLEPIIVADGIFYINTTFALAAPTAAAGTWAAPAAGSWAGKILKFALDVETGLMPFHGVRGATVFDRAMEKEKYFTLKITALMDAAASNSPGAERVAAAAGTMRFVTLNFIGTGNKKFRFAGACYHETGEFLTIGEQDGLDVVEMSFIGHYDPTGAKQMQFAVASDETTAP